MINGFSWDCSRSSSAIKLYNIKRICLSLLFDDCLIEVGGNFGDIVLRAHCGGMDQRPVSLHAHRIVSVSCEKAAFRFWIADFGLKCAVREVGMSDITDANVHYAEFLHDMQPGSRQRATTVAGKCRPHGEGKSGFRFILAGNYAIIFVKVSVLRRS